MTMARSTGRVPKPNTRFLKTLVREADSHNTALKRKEEVEARLRLERIGSEERSRESRRQYRHASDGERGHDRAGDGDRKRRRLSDGVDDSRRARHIKHERRRTSSRSRSPKHEKSQSRERAWHEKRRHDGRDDNGEQRRERRSKHHHSSRRSLSRSKDRPKRDVRKDGSRHERPQQAQKEQSRNTSPSASSTTSDPLSSIIGPRPAAHHPARRGRGFQRDPPTSNIDIHFSSHYNPSLDLEPDLDSSQEGEDWDNALEALRDRRAWRTKQADRMREAGFGEEEIKRWETTTSRPNAAEGNEDARHVKWRKKGEEREWDAGKVPRRSDGAGDDMNVDNSLSTTGLQKERTQNAAVKTTASTEQSGRSTTKSVNDNWQRADSGLLRQFRNALR